jgi:hypothetical protein
VNALGSDAALLEAGLDDRNGSRRAEDRHNKLPSARTDEYGRYVKYTEAPCGGATSSCGVGHSVSFEGKPRLPDLTQGERGHQDSLAGLARALWGGAR